MRIKTLFILISLLTMIGCFPDNKYAIKITNNSSRDIMVLPGYNRFGANEYPDSTLPSTKPSLLIVRKHDYNFLDASFEWKVVINDLPSDTLSLFYFDADSVETIPWNKIQTKYIILKRDDLSVSDLETNNWSQTFD